MKETAMAISVILIFFFVIILIVYIEIRKIVINKKLRDFEKLRELPILGVAGRILGKSNYDFIELVSQCFDEAKTATFRVWLGPILALGIYDPKAVEILLTNDNCINKPYIYEHFHCKTSLIVTDQDQWKPNRRALNTAFTVSTLQNYIPQLNDKSRILLKQMSAHLNEAGDIYRTISICMIDMVTRTMMGTEMHLQSNERGEFIYKIAKQIMNSIQYRLTRIWLRWDFVYFYLSKVGRDERQPLKDGNAFIDEIYECKVNELDILKSQGMDYLQDARENRARNFLEKCISLEQDGALSHENVLDQMRVVMLAGIDTSSITVFGTLLMLAINQKHQDLVVEELRSVLGTVDCEVSSKHLAAMKYTERVIKETMRLLPPVPFMARQLTADVDFPNGTVPKGTMIGVSIVHMHRNPKIWGENVLEFDPDRFKPEYIEKRPPFSYIPFSAGPRNCIGLKYGMMSAKITLAHLLRQYKFSTDLKFDDIRVFTHLVLDIANEKPLRIERRYF